MSFHPLSRAPVRTAASGAVAAIAVAALVLALTTHSGSRASTASVSTTPKIQTASGSVGPLRITGGYIPKPANPAIAAAYFTVANTSDLPDSLLSVSSTASEHVTLHRTVEHGTASTMVSVAALPVPAHKSLALAVGGNHAMLEDPVTMNVGQQVPITLHFAHAGLVTLQFPVVPLTATNEDLDTMDMSGTDMSGTDMSGMDMSGMDMTATAPARP